MAHGRATAKYRVKLTAEERHELEQRVRDGRMVGWKLRRVQALLKFDEGEGGPGWSNAKIAEAFEVTTRSLENWRKQSVEHGPLSLLDRKKRDGSKQRKLDGVGEAALVKLACSSPPQGRSRWTLRLLADPLVTLEIVDSIGYECVRQTLKKTR